MPIAMLPFAYCNVSYDLFEEELVNVEVSLAQVRDSLLVVHITLEVRKITTGSIIIPELLLTIKFTTVQHI